MFGFGKKKVPLDQALRFFVEETSKGIDQQLPSIRDGWQQVMPDIDSISDDDLFEELLLAVLAAGMQPVRNLWDSRMHDSACREVPRIIGLGQPAELEADFRERFERYLHSWENGLASGNMPMDQIAGDLLINLGIGRMEMHGRGVVSPLASMAVSSLITALVGPYWKNLKTKVRLV